MKRQIWGACVACALGVSSARAELPPLPYQDFTSFLSRAVQTGYTMEVENLPSYLCAEASDVQIALTHLTESRVGGEIVAEARCVALTAERPIRIQKVYSYSIVVKDSCYAYVEVIVDSKDVHLIFDASDSTQPVQAVQIKDGARWVVRTTVSDGQCP